MLNMHVTSASKNRVFPGENTVSCSTDSICGGVPWKEYVTDRRVVWALDAESAAEMFAERYDSNDGDYPIIKNGRGEVWILDENNVETKWDIEAETVPEYRAHEKRVTANPRADHE